MHRNTHTDIPRTQLSVCKTGEIGTKVCKCDNVSLLVLISHYNHKECTIRGDWVEVKQEPYWGGAEFQLEGFLDVQLQEEF